MVRLQKPPGNKLMCDSLRNKKTPPATPLANCISTQKRKGSDDTKFE